MTSLVLLATGIEAGVILSIIAVGASIAAGFLLQQKTVKAALKDETPTTIATRGSFIPYVIGRRRVGALFAYVGNRYTSHESAGGATKGFGSKSKASKQIIYHESGWHILCVGPAVKLHAIYQAGQPILSGGLSPESAPSGTQIVLGEGTFRIYWGEQDQPLGAEVYSAIGVNSRWPFCCYIFWETKRLGTAPRWPVLDYEIEVPIHTSHLLNTPGNMPPSFTAGSQVLGFLKPNGNVARAAQVFVTPLLSRSQVAIGSKITLAGNHDSSYDGTYTIFDASISKYVSPVTTLGRLATVITLEEPLPDATDPPSPYAPIEVVTIDLVNSNNNDGSNHAHAVAQMLFDKWPHGMGMDKTLFNLDYFEAAAETLATEDIRGSYLADDGVLFSTVIGHFLQDMGAMIPWERSSGKFLLRLVRQESSPPEIPEQLVNAPLPKIQTVHGLFAGGEARATKVVFSFADRELAYRQMTVNIDDDGKATLLEWESAKTVGMPTVNDFPTAGIMAERRSQEEIGQGAVYTVKPNREARLLFPGQALVVHGVAPMLRIMSMQIDPYSGVLQIDCVTDFYGAKQSSFSWNPLTDELAIDTPFQEETPLDEDIISSTGDGRSVYELPAFLSDVRDVSLLVPRVRAHDGVPAARIWLSADDVTYRVVATETSLQTGGELIDELTAADPFFIESGPTFTVLGDDISILEDLTGDNANWYGGRQLAIIGSEVFFVRNVELIAGTTYRLRGLIRARYGSARNAHAAGDMVHLFLSDSIITFRDLLVKPGRTIYVKVQPVGGPAEVDLDELTAIEHAVVGGGLAPMQPHALRLETLKNSWPDGSDLRFKWCYRSAEFPGTGAGLQGAGDPTGSSAVLGKFKVNFYSYPGLVLKASYVTECPFFTYFNEDLVADFGEEPTALYAQVYHVIGGLESSATTLIVYKES